MDQKFFLEMLNEQFQKVEGTKNFQEKDEKDSTKQFHLQFLKDNLIEPMTEPTEKQFIRGKEHELEYTMKGLHSSLAMIYNLFGNNKANIVGDKNIGAGTYAVEYEKHFQALKKPAFKKEYTLMDSFLYNETNKEAVAIEADMLGWLFNKPENLPKNFLNTKKYKDEDIANTFIGVAKSIMKDSVSKDKDYEANFKHFNAFLMFEHILAGYNSCREKKPEMKKITLVSCIWELPLVKNSKALPEYETVLKEEHEEFEKFAKLIGPLKALFINIGTDFNIKYYSYNNFMKLVKLDDKQQKYLSRYSFE